MPLPLAIPALWATLKVSKLFWGAIGLVAVLGLLWGSLAAYGGARYKAGLSAGAERERAAQSKITAKVVKRQDRVTAKVERQAEKAQAKIEYRYRTLREKVRVYVPLHTQAGVISAGDLVPASTVLLLDAAVRGDEPEPLSVTGGQSYELASAVRFDQLVGGYVVNLGLGHQNARQLSDLQDWVREQEAASP